MLLKINLKYQSKKLYIQKELNCNLKLFSYIVQYKYISYLEPTTKNLLHLFLLICDNSLWQYIYTNFFVVKICIILQRAKKKSIDKNLHKIDGLFCTELSYIGLN